MFFFICIFMYLFWIFPEFSVLTNEPEWNPPVSAILPPIPDVLPQVQTSEDWQAAFGFSNSNNSRNNYQSSDINRAMVNIYNRM